MHETLPVTSPYEPPRIERVLTPEELAHEVMYAGPGVVSLSDEIDQ